MHFASAQVNCAVATLARLLALLNGALALAAALFCAALASVAMPLVEALAYLDGILDSGHHAAGETNPGLHTEGILRVTGKLVTLCYSTMMCMDAEASGMSMTALDALSSFTGAIADITLTPLLPPKPHCCNRVDHPWWAWPFIWLWWRAVVLMW